MNASDEPRDDNQIDNTDTENTSVEIASVETAPVEIASVETAPIETAANEGEGARPRRSGASERAIRAAIEIFARWENDDKNTPLDRITSGEFRTRKYLNSTERRWVAEAVYNCARFWRRQVYLLEAKNEEPTSENVVRLWVEQDATKHVALPDKISKIEDPHTYLRIGLSFTDEMAQELESLLGNEAISAAEAFNQQAPTTLRVNPLRVSWDHLRRTLPEATPTRYSPWGLELANRVNIFDVQGFRTGWFEVQEEASQLVTLLTDGHPGHAIAEIGAGAGGKTLALAALIENKGEIFALDNSKLRIDELTKRAERAGVTCVQTCEINSNSEGIWQPSVSIRRTVNRWSGRADIVLIDAPCTGSGVLRRSPDAKWREFDMGQMIQIQRNLLSQAATMVGSEGHLIYVTCAFERAQNEEIVAWFLDTEFGSQFEVVPAVPRLYEASIRARQQAQTPPFLRTEKAQQKLAEKSDAPLPAITPATLDDFETMASGPYLRTWPHRHGLDAFFAACLKRK